jgi:hypothetical protein
MLKTTLRWTVKLYKFSVAAVVLSCSSGFLSCLLVFNCVPATLDCTVNDFLVNEKIFLVLCGCQK